MSFSDKQIEALTAPLIRTHVMSRKQAGREVSYIASWFAESEANRIFGFDGWDSTITDLRMVSEREVIIGKGSQYEKPGWSVSYICTVSVAVNAGDGLVVYRQGVGAGHGIDADLGQAHESAVKEGASDAEKRALKTFGNPFGLALYDKTQANVVDAPAPEPERQGRKSAAQAKRDGDDLIIKTAISKLTPEGLEGWHANFDDLTSHVPASWLDSIRDMLVMRAEELNAPPEAAEMDRAFAETVR